MAKADLTAEFVVTKSCSDCKQCLPLAGFSKAGQGSRYRPQCKGCTKAREQVQLVARRLNVEEQPAQRVCTCCGQEKPFTTDYFKPKVFGAFGLSSECKKCLGERNKRWQKTPVGRATRSRYVNTNRAKVRLWALASQKRRRDKVNAYMRSWREQNLEHVREWSRLWARKNRVHRSAYRQMRRAAGKVGKEQIEGLLIAQRHKCAVCRCRLKQLWEVDHIQPVALGGRSDPGNLQILCRPCNRSKGAKDPIQFMQRRGFLI